MIQPNRAVAAVAIGVLCAANGAAYSVLTHEALVDAVWDVELKGILSKRFPTATPEQLKEAHGYAYGGAVIQDSGFYPRGSYQFSDLTHYVRSGDFILALLSESHTLDEYAFALGALSHYYGDAIGHRYGTNVSEPLLYQKLRKKYGNFITYADSPDAHLRTEYGFDVEEVAKGNFAPQNYHDFIGFQVAKSSLVRAFQKTYGFGLDQLYGDLDEAIGSYRHTLATLIPFFTRVAWAAHKSEILKAQPSMSRAQFIYIMNRSSYEREWGKQYDQPSFFDKLVAVLVKLLPPLGRIKVLKFKALTPGTFQIFMHSFDMAEPDYRRASHAADENKLHLINFNFDTGSVTHAGQYHPQDDAYAFWLDELSQLRYATVTGAMRDNILAFYRDLKPPVYVKQRGKDWQRVLRELEELKAAKAS
jgi:hypothetical protein